MGWKLDVRDLSFLYKPRRELGKMIFIYIRKVLGTPQALHALLSSLVTRQILWWFLTSATPGLEVFLSTADEKSSVLYKAQHQPECLFPHQFMMKLCVQPIGKPSQF